MNLEQEVLWAELKHKIPQSVMMINDGYLNEEMIQQLLEAFDILDNTQPRRPV